MTEAQFNSLRPLLTRWKESAVQVAYAVLVDGRTRLEAADQAGLTVQRVSAIYRDVLALVPEGTPANWERVEVWLPPKLSARVRDIEQKAFAERAEAQTANAPTKQRVGRPPAAAKQPV